MADTNVSIEQIVKDIEDGKKDILSLDFTSPRDIDIALKCLQKKQLLARRLDITKLGHIEVLKQWIASNYVNLLILNSDQRCKELIDVYLEGKYTSQLAEWKKANAKGDMSKPLAKNIAIIHSYTKQQIICYEYETKKGETVSYFDEKLGIPVKLKTDAKIKLKLLDSLKLVKKVDVELERFDLGITISTVHDVFTDNLKSVLLKLIDGQKVSYYDIPKHWPEIHDALVKSLQVAYEQYGLGVAEVKIGDITLTNDIDKQIEKQYFGLAKIARVKEFEFKQEEQSLKLYEQKAKIHSAYPEFQVGLTEVEKDLALERYLKRIDKVKDLDGDTKEQVLPDRDTTGAGDLSKAVVTKPTEPTKPVASNGFRVTYSILASVWLVVTVLLCALGSMTAGIVVGAVGAVALLITGIICRCQLKHGYSKAVKDAYDNAKKDYDRNMAEYNLRDSGATQQAQQAPQPEQPQAQAAATTAQPKSDN